MPDFRITIDIKDVAQGDATGVAQDILDTHGSDFDAAMGDFKLTVYKVDGNFSTDVDWEPNE